MGLVPNGDVSRVSSNRKVGLLLTHFCGLLCSLVSPLLYYVDPDVNLPG